MTREEAIKKIKWGIAGLIINKDIRDALETLVPELRDSEDERIRKALIWHLKAGEDFVSNGVTKAECIAYLEKQKEFPFVKDVVPGLPGLYFYDGERMHFQGNPATEEKQEEQKPAEWNERHIADIFEKVGLAKIAREQGNDALTNAVQSAMIELSKTKPAEWSDEDETKLRDVVRLVEDSGHVKSIREHYEKFLTSLPKRFNLQPKQEWSEEDDVQLDAAIQIVSNSGHSTTANWLKSLRPVKQEWSEEDEKMRWDLINAFTDKNNSKVDEFMQLRATKADIIDWLKSLRPSWKPSEQEKGALRTAIYVLTDERSFPKTAAQLQNILDAFEGKESRKDWKPSEEQIEALKAAMDRNDSIGYNLGQLYEQLKKLM